jgi:hypothetical protein
MDCDAHADVNTLRPILTLQRALGIERTRDGVTRLPEYSQHAVALASRLDDLPAILCDLL